MPQPSTDAATVLVTVSGKDRPGVSAALFAALGVVDAPVLDIEQVVIRGRLTLGVLLGHADPAQVRAAVAGLAAALDLDVQVSGGAAEDDPRRAARLHVTVVGAPLTSSTIAGLATRLASMDANIDRILRLATYPVTSIGLEVSGADLTELRTALAEAATALGGRHRRAAGRAGAPLEAPARDGRRLDAHPGRGHRDARRGGRLPRRGRASDGAGDARGAGLRRLAARAGRPARRPAGRGARAGPDRVDPDPGARTLVRTLRRLGY